MIYCVGEKVLILARVVQKIENEEGVSYEVVAGDNGRCYPSLRVSQNDIKTVLK